jgi:hypothetical protein
MKNNAIVNNTGLPQSVPASVPANTESDLIPIDIDAALKPSGLEALRVVGGHQLNGDIYISGAKNAALKLMCAALADRRPLNPD